MSCTAPSTTVEVLDQDAFLRSGEAWDRLLQSSYDNRLFYSASWLSIWWRHFGADHARVFVLRDDDRWLGALPLQLTEANGRQVASLIGDFNVADYMDALALKDGADTILRRLWERALTDLPDVDVDLRHVPSTSALIAALQSTAEERGLSVTVDDDEVCPVALLCSSWDGYLQMLSKKQRHEIRRKLRRAQEGAEWDWRTAQTEDDLHRDLPVFFRLHEASAREKARFMTPVMRGYFADLASAMLKAGTLRLSVFQREGQDLAATISFLYRDRYLLYNSGYDPGAAAYSPGIAAVSHAMQDAIEEKAAVFDFLSGDETYKYQMGATNTHTCRVQVKGSGT